MDKLKGLALLCGALIGCAAETHQADFADEIVGEAQGSDRVTAEPDAATEELPDAAAPQGREDSEEEDAGSESDPEPTIACAGGGFTYELLSLDGTAYVTCSANGQEGSAEYDLSGDAGYLECDAGSATFRLAERHRVTVGQDAGQSVSYIAIVTGAGPEQIVLECSE